MTTLTEAALLVIAATSVFVVGYYAVVNLNYLVIHLASLVELRNAKHRADWRPPYEQFGSPFLPGVAVVVPAYNESANIVESLRSLLALEYPDKEIVVVNDGSTDDTLDRLVAAFDLRPVDATYPLDVPAEEIRGVYRSREYGELLVVDKENGGKSDALNAGVWLTEQELFCAVDADTVIDRQGLLQIVRPFLERPRTTVATGGTVRVVNDCTVEHGEVTDVTLPRSLLARLQSMEYLRAFYAGRVGLDKLNGLVLISGAFGVFRTDLVRQIDGYRHDTITEDFDLVVRLHRYLIDEDREYRVRFVPEPVAWTEAPESRRVLSRQRSRWYRGMVETLRTHWRLLGNPRYGVVGLYALPFFAVAEMLGPLVEALGYVLIPVAIYLGILDVEFFVVFFLVTTGVGILLSWFGVFSEVWAFRRYRSTRDIARLLAYGVLENFGYRQWKTFVAVRGLVQYLRGNTSWGVMERRGFAGDDDATDDGAVHGTVSDDASSVDASPGDVPAPTTTPNAGPAARSPPVFDPFVYDRAVERPPSPPGTFDRDPFVYGHVFDRDPFVYGRLVDRNGSTGLPTTVLSRSPALDHPLVRSAEVTVDPFIWNVVRAPSPAAVLAVAGYDVTASETDPPSSNGSPDEE